MAGDDYPSAGNEAVTAPFDILPIMKTHHMISEQTDLSCLKPTSAHEVLFLDVPMAVPLGFKVNFASTHLKLLHRLHSVMINIYYHPPLKYILMSIIAKEYCSPLEE